MLPIPRTGQVALVIQLPPNAAGTRHLRHVWLDARDIHEQTEPLHAALDRCQTANDAGSDIFFSLAGFAGDLTEFHGRKSANVVAVRSLWLDIDTLKWGIDASTTGFDALFDWIEQCPQVLIPSAVVLSGGGLHVYFTCDRDIPLDVWHDMADRLRNGAGQVFHQAVDGQCTIDRARILRVPGYRTWKYEDTTVEVLWPTNGDAPVEYTVDELHAMTKDWPRTAAALGTSTPTLFPGLTTSAPTTGSAFSDVVVDTPASWSRMADAARNGAGCGVLAQAMADNAGVGYDTWCGLLTVIACTDGIEEGIHSISAEHPDWGDTQNVETALSKARSFGGPRKCVSFDSAACRTCKHSGRITSPVEIGRPHVKLQEAAITVVTPAATPDEESVVWELPQAPVGFSYEHKGKRGVFIHQREKDDRDGSWDDAIEPLWTSPVWVQSRCTSDGTGLAVGKLAFWNARGQLKTVPYNGAVIGAMDVSPLIKALVNSGNVPLRTYTDKMGFTMHTSFLAGLTQYQGNTSMVVNQYGPLSEHDRSGFSLGKVRYNTDGTTEPVQIDPTAEQAEAVAAGLVDALPSLREQGRIKAEWNTHLRAVHGVQGGLSSPARALDRMLVATGFGAVLPMFMEDAGHQGGYISLMSNAAGSGKTSMLRTALSIYARRTGSLIVNDTTENGWRGVTWTACALPVLLDDFWSNDKKGDIAGRVKGMLLASTSKSKRASRLGGCEFNATWTYMTGNKDVATEISVADSAAGGALRRMFNICVPERKVSPQDSDRYNQFTDWQDESGGVIGHLWVRHVVTHVAELKARRQHWKDTLRRECPPLADHQYEFVLAMCLNTMVAAEAAGSIGLHPYQTNDILTTLVSYAQQSWDAMTDAIVTDDGVMADLLTRATPGTIVANKNGNLNHSTDRLPVMSQQIYARRYPDTGEVAISKAGLKLLCTLAKVQLSRAIADMKAHGCTEEVVDLAEGTTLQGMKVLCFVVKIGTSIPHPSKERS